MIRISELKLLIWVSIEKRANFYRKRYFTKFLAWFCAVVSQCKENKKDMYVYNKGKYLHSICINAFIPSIDATESHRIGKYINDSPRRYANAVMKPIVVNQFPRLCLFAATDIRCGEELR